MILPCFYEPLLTEQKVPNTSLQKSEKDKAILVGGQPEGNPDTHPNQHSVIWRKPEIHKTKTGFPMPLMTTQGLCSSSDKLLLLISFSYR